MTPLIIYVPGLGDIYDNGRRLALKFWRVWGVEAKLVPMRWNDGQSLDRKADRINHAIDEALAAGRKIYLIGESAGASLAIQVATERTKHIAGLLTLCGVVSPRTPVSGYLRNRAPAFDEALKTLAGSLPRLDAKRTVTVSGYGDASVVYQFSTIAGMPSHRLMSLGHLTTIAAGLTIYSWLLVKWLAAIDRN